ncbi:MAG: glycosyltransferase family 4 protein [Candidatus Moranbacteria bacterium]|nr:glycosyltransferase family 4 protein [Candidatus Moranbacteria bacterium]
MNILVVAPTPFFSDRGTHIRILEEALALEKRGHEVTIATYHIGADIPKHLHSRIDVRRIRRLLFWYKKLEAGPDWQKIILDLLLIKKTFFLARTKKPDIIHAHLHEGALIGWIVQKVLFWHRIRLVVDFHGSLTKEMVSHHYLRMSGLFFLFRWLEKCIDNMGDAAVTSSWENTDDINTLRRKKDAETLLDGTRLSMFDGVLEKSVLRERYGISRDAIVITYTGALIPNKGVGLFLEMIPLVSAQYPKVHFIIAGFPLNEIAGFLRQDVFRTRVKVISPLSYFDLPSVLKMSDIGVDPKEATTRQASGKMLQYMGAGLPVACFDTANNREYLGEGGVYASETTAKSLSHALGILIENEVLRREKGEINFVRSKQFSWEKSAEILEKIYKKLL